jgi:hypothetical protein
MEPQSPKSLDASLACGSLKRRPNSLLPDDQENSRLLVWVKRLSSIRPGKMGREAALESLFEFSFGLSAQFPLFEALAARDGAGIQLGSPSMVNDFEDVPTEDLDGSVLERT